MRGKPHSSQLQLAIFEPPSNPFDCPHELKRVDIGGGKSLCALMDSWTNCREVARCVYAAIHG